jgi:glycine/D-amino acid oxidase-like deaminating enzyme
MIADVLTEEGLKVAIADTRGPAKGSTVASTALVVHEIDTPLTKLMKKIGKRDARRAWRRSRLAVDAIAARLGELAGRDLVRRDSLYLAGDLLDEDELAREHRARLAAGLASSYLDRKSLRERFGLSRSSALLSYDDLAIDPRETTLALLKAACSRKARIFSPCEIVNVEAGRRGVVATAQNGKSVHCQNLIFASGYEIPDSVPRKGQKIVSTWAIATVPQKRLPWPEQCMIWEASETYLYLRTTRDGRILCGGEDEEFSSAVKRDALLPRKTAVLQRKLHRLMPRVDTRVEFGWAGSFGVTDTGLPKIGRIPGMPNCWAALGYGGNGTTYARIAADVIRGALINKTDVDADLYAF